MRFGLAESSVIGMISAAIIIIFVFVAFCCNEKTFSEQKKYTVIDHSGKVHRNMVSDGEGFGWHAFKNEYGKELVVRGNYSYTEEMQ